MGNGSSTGNSRRLAGNKQPRVMLEAPAGSNTQVQRTVTFADQRRSHVETIRVRPQMTDVGQFVPEIYRNGRKVRYTRSQSMRLAQSVNLMDSTTSVRSSASLPIDGVWEPTLNPYNSIREPAFLSQSPRGVPETPNSTRTNETRGTESRGLSENGRDNQSTSGLSNNNYVNQNGQLGLNSTHYSGFAENDYQYGSFVRNGLTTVEEI